MNPNKLILTETISYIILYLLSYVIAFDIRLTPGGDAAGNGMERGFLLLFLVVLFFFIAIVLTVINLFMIKKVNSRGIKLLAFFPIFISIGHILSLFLFG